MEYKDYNVFNTTHFVVTMITTICNLKCKHCCSYTPYRSNPQHFSLGDLKHDINRYFEIFYEANYPHFDFIGGEPLLHPDLPELCEWIFDAHHDKFGQLRILSNGSIKLSKKLLDTCKDKNVYFLMDDYGAELSIHAVDNCKALEELGIAHNHRIYYGENQYFGGWIDFGGLEHKNYSEKELDEVFNSCKELISPKSVSKGAIACDLHIQDGKVYACDMQLANAKHIPRPPDEYIDLRTDEPVELIRSRLLDFKKKPLEYCKYCSGFVTQNKRVPAAQQLTNEEQIVARKYCD